MECVLDKIKKKAYEMQKNMRLAITALNTAENEGEIPPQTAEYIRWMLKDTQREIEDALGVPKQEEQCPLNND